MRRIFAILVAGSFAAAAQQKPAPKGPPAPPAATPPAPALLPLPATSTPPNAEAVDLLPLPPLQPPPLDLGLLLQDSTLCIFPFVKESAGASEKTYLDSVQKTFFDVAKESPLFKKNKDSVLLLGQSTKCDPHDAACVAAVGKLAHCQNVLVGSSAAKGNGYVLSVRIFDVSKQRILPGSEVEQVLETDRQTDVSAWAEGEACRALQVKCVAPLYVDADRRDMNIYVDNRLAPRTFKSPERYGVPPGVHEVRTSIGQRTSLPKKVAVRRAGLAETIYVRQTEKGGIPLYVASEQRGTKPSPSVEFHEGSWTKPVGYSVAAAGVVAAGIGVFELMHGRSQISDADSAAAARGGIYTTTEASNISSAKSAEKVGAALAIASGVLIATGLTLVFAF
jgi:hypothetical protein